MNSNQKNSFRRTKRWADFRRHIRELFGDKDAITGEKLRKGWQLHHMDLDADNYSNLDPDRFIPLNPGTHDLIHRLYTFIVYDKNGRVDRMLEYIGKMRRLNSIEETE